MVPDFAIYITVFLIVVIIIFNIIILWYVVNQYNSCQCNKDCNVNLNNDLKKIQEDLMQTQKLIKKCNCYNKNSHPKGCKCDKCCKKEKCNDPCESANSCKSSENSYCENELYSDSSCSDEYSSEDCNLQCNNSNKYKKGLLKPNCKKYYD